MNNSIKLTLAATLAACAIPSYAESIVEVNAPDNGGVTTAPLSTGTVISFKTNGFEIANDGSATTSIAYANAEKISFKTSGSSVTTIDAKRKLRLRRNPVESTLEIEGHDGNIARMTVTSLAGHTLISQKDWNGTSINVAALNPGLYLLNINNQTFKFIKK